MICELVICGACKQAKPRNEFYADKKKKNGLYSKCKFCQRIYARKYGALNRSKINKQMREHKVRLRQEKKLMVLKLLAEKGCIDCGNRDPRCLDFDHVRDTKRNCISVLVGNTCSDETILNEINKCEVRCANCHRIKTAKEQDWYSYIDFVTMTLISD